MTADLNESSSPTQVGSAPPAASEDRHGIGTLLTQYAERLALPTLLLGLIIAFTIAPGTRLAFPTQANLQSLALTQCVIAIAAIAVTIPLVAGQFDVSVGPVLGMTSILTGKITVEHGGPVWLAVVVGPLAGALVGALSGYVIAFLRTSGRR